MTDDIQIRTFPEQTVLVVSKRVKAADIKSAMGDAFRALMRAPRHREHGFHGIVNACSTAS